MNVSGDIMKKLKNENRFMFTWGICVIVLFLMCSFSLVIKGTRAHFGGVTGTLEIPYNVYYLSNWPDSSVEDEKIEHKSKNDYYLLSNMFDVPFGYEFVGWNTQADGGGILYIGTSNIKLTEDLYLYAQWNELARFYGDVNENNMIDENDYLIINSYISGGYSLGEQALRNADVNKDGKVNFVDVDIVKQAYLGTVGYVGYLPDNPILIYDIYDGNIDVSTDNSNDGNINNGGGTGTGHVGTGSGSNGNSQNNNSSSSGSGNASSGGNSTDGGNNEEDVPLDDNNNIDDSKKEIYVFKFMNGNVEYASSSCKIINSTCLLVLPSENPVSEGYRFTGWSLNKGCPEGSGFVRPVYVDSDKIYYACFENNNSSGNNMYLWIIVFGICIISIRLIWYLIVSFRKKYRNIND